MIDVLITDNEIKLSYNNDNNEYNLEVISINGVETPVTFKVNKNKNGRKFFYIKTSKLFFTITNNKVNGEHISKGGFKGDLNVFLNFIKNDEDRTFSCACGNE